MIAKTDARRVSVEGVLAPCAWDEDCNVTALMIHSAQEKDYSVLESGCGRTLFKHCPAVVSVTGYAFCEAGRTMLDVESFRILSR
ncbi:MAG: hypothetical protein H0S85_09110 [Desulfovibrionaceae bacterium]|jgi:hypothetical protein|nr:hypothetical protein [Desulfovibrionaceae bacterium]